LASQSGWGYEFTELLFVKTVGICIDERKKFFVVLYITKATVCSYILEYFGVCCLVLFGSSWITIVVD
jgi:hypothetical protein